ncbi:uncharacterized protein BO72DRAFT_497575 [Aspergillus fijiensis CBS 313.89]|uniref:Uncharacterized protein n=1 Tax=Aspergillus fijiensis CBS 313.89 TaxID=1448319 RepID=A0A8G1VXY1_9EURO|nr:uncharacterized protein BO72DRAFT_497575 [Aspergillus fijiensis CBS 313.89]RAK75843.1 hypothetical protein BO72DRAFT_497575 [Aspergillus fijiensis CBS 313.89]
MEVHIAYHTKFGTEHPLVSNEHRGQFQWADIEGYRRTEAEYFACVNPRPIEWKERAIHPRLWYRCAEFNKVYSNSCARGVTQHTHDFCGCPIACDISGRTALHIWGYDRYVRKAAFVAKVAIAREIMVGEQLAPDSPLMRLDTIYSRPSFPGQTCPAHSEDGRFHNHGLQIDRENSATHRSRAAGRFIGSLVAADRMSDGP